MFFMVVYDVEFDRIVLFGGFGLCELIVLFLVDDVIVFVYV